MEINEYKKFVRSFSFESNIKRSQNRKDKTEEYFTPTKVAQEVLDKMEESKPDLFSDKTKKLLDNACGDGQFLTEIVIRKMTKSGCTLVEALSVTFGVDLMKDNVILCRQRLGGINPTQEIIDILEKNIVCADALTYDYNFGEPKGLEKYL